MSEDKHNKGQDVYTELFFFASSKTCVHTNQNVI
jgi:hypothetical protein